MSLLVPLWCCYNRDHFALPIENPYACFLQNLEIFTRLKFDFGEINVSRTCNFRTLAQIPLTIYKQKYNLHAFHESAALLKFKYTQKFLVLQYPGESRFIGQESVVGLRHQEFHQTAFSHWHTFWGILWWSHHWNRKIEFEMRWKSRNTKQRLTKHAHVIKKWVGSK